MLEFLEKPSVLIVLLVVIVVFGAKRLPDSARALGRSMRILKAEAKGLKEDGASSDTASDTASAPAPKQLPEATTEQEQSPQQQSPHQT